MLILIYDLFNVFISQQQLTSPSPDLDLCTNDFQRQTRSVMVLNLTSQERFMLGTLMPVHRASPPGAEGVIKASHPAYCRLPVSEWPGLQGQGRPCMHTGCQRSRGLFWLSNNFRLVSVPVHPVLHSVTVFCGPCTDPCPVPTARELTCKVLAY